MLGENSPSVESWLHQQANYDLWKAAQKINPITKIIGYEINSKLQLSAVHKAYAR